MAPMRRTRPAAWPRSRTSRALKRAGELLRVFVLLGLCRLGDVPGTSSHQEPALGGSLRDDSYGTVTAVAGGIGRDVTDGVLIADIVRDTGANINHVGDFLRKECLSASRARQPAEHVRVAVGIVFVIDAGRVDDRVGLLRQVQNPVEGVGARVVAAIADDDQYFLVEDARP